MRHHRLFAAGVSVALLLGAATPALATPGKGKAKGHQNTTPADSKPAKGPKPADPKPAKPKPKPADPKPGKGPKAGVSGGGSVTPGSFSVQARTDQFAQTGSGKRRGPKGHLNYTSTDGKYKVRCKGFNPTTDSLTITGKTAVLKAKCATLAPKHSRPYVWVEATFEDLGDGAEAATATPSPKDKVGFKFYSIGTYDASTVPAHQYYGELTEGNVKVR